MPRRKADGTKSKQLTIYCMLPGVTNFSDALKNPNTAPAAVPVTIPPYQAEFRGSVSTGGKPDWVHMIEGGIQPPAQSPFTNLGSRRPNGVLFIRVRNRIFAISFGSGYTMLDDEKWEPRFGLRIALNLADDSNLQQAAFRSHQGRTFTREVSASRLSGFYDFGFDGERDFVKRITAKLKSNPLSARITGKESVSIVCPAGLTDLHRKCAELYRLFRSTKYTQRFPDVDQIVPETRTGQIALLEQQLDTLLQNPNTPLVHFAYPDLINYDRYSGMKIATSANVVDDLEIATLQAEMGIPALSVAAMKASTAAIWLVDDNGHEYDPKPLFACCIAEVTVGNDTYLLSEGAWHRLEGNYVTTLNNFINGVRPGNTLAAVPRNGQTSENAYLMALKPLQNHGFVVAHKEMVMHGGGRSRLEVCDLLKSAPQGAKWQLIHVKGGGGGEEFGHLASQAYASAEALTDLYSTFGTDALTKLTPQFQTNNVTVPIALPNKAKDYDIVFAVFAPAGVQPSDVTTLFGKIAFRRSAKALERLGFDVFLELMPP